MTKKIPVGKRGVVAEVTDEGELCRIIFPPGIFVPLPSEANGLLMRGLEKDLREWTHRDRAK